MKWRKFLGDYEAKTPDGRSVMIQVIRRPSAAGGRGRTDYKLWRPPGFAEPLRTYKTLKQAKAEAERQFGTGAAGKEARQAKRIGESKWKYGPATLELAGPNALGRWWATAKARGKLKRFDAPSAVAAYGAAKAWVDREFPVSQQRGRTAPTEQDQRRSLSASLRKDR